MIQPTHKPTKKKTPQYLKVKANNTKICLFLKLIKSVGGPLPTSLCHYQDI